MADSPVLSIPTWLLRPLPINSKRDSKLESQIEKLAKNLPGSLAQLTTELSKVKMFREYDSAANLASRHVWVSRYHFLNSSLDEDRKALLEFAQLHMTPTAKARIIRRLSKDPQMGVRRAVHRIIQKAPPYEVALPEARDGNWDASGWTRGVQPGRLMRVRRGQKKTQKEWGLPGLSTVKQLRTLLGIKSEKQLGYLLLATDEGGGPYTRFSIQKRNGSDREICAPKPQLLWVQRKILHEILDKVPLHESAHGFVRGRSTVTNATPHRGAAFVLKFDLENFFPTVHYYRVMGLFANLGYSMGNGRFEARDKSRQIAPVLARLCVFVEDPNAWGTGFMPQGAPTSPAISNLVCRGMDARLAGLAEQVGGVYTRYADDLTFSFPETSPVNVGRFRWWVDQICHQEGFFLNQSKFRVIRRSQRQTVTGIVVNDELRVPRRERRRFRAILHNCKAQGVESQARGNPAFRDYLRGFASYLN
ncbi:MAG: RNA-directed DNA polymerase, partial [Planctomycetaceae bacterium]|nr:RNA-directed DNA polymerase [Planctomycetaceae bacterium]